MGRIESLRDRFLALAGAAACGALVLTPAVAEGQLVPGLRPPENAAEAFDDSQSMVCFLAAAGRPMGGLNIPFVGGEGYKPLDRLPEALLPFVEATADQRVVQYEAPGETIWIVHDPKTGRCATYAFTDPAPVEAKLLQSLARPGAWKRKPASGGADHVFEWAIDKPLRLRTEIRLPKAPGDPVAVIVSPFRR